MAERKDRMALLSRYSRLYLQRYEVKPVLNLNKEQWASDALIESFGLPECYSLLEYYFEASQNPSWSFFINNAEKIVDAVSAQNQDAKERAERRKKAKEWLSE
jgi:hypothetical protein